MSSTANGYSSLNAPAPEPAPPAADPTALASVPDPDPDEEARKRKQREASEKMVQTKKENATRRKHKEEEQKLHLVQTINKYKKRTTALEARNKALLLAVKFEVSPDKLQRVMDAAQEMEWEAERARVHTAERDMVLPELPTASDALEASPPPPQRHASLAAGAEIAPNPAAPLPVVRQAASSAPEP